MNSSMKNVNPSKVWDAFQLRLRTFIYVHITARREKAPESVCFRGFCVIAHRFCSLTPAYRKEGGVWGWNLSGFPRSRSVTRPQATTFAKQRSKSAAPETKPPLRGGFVSGILQHYRCQANPDITMVHICKRSFRLNISWSWTYVQ